MATTLTDRIADLARQIATDQIAQEIDNNSKFATKTSISDYESRLSAIEAKLNELISVAWVEQKVDPLAVSETTE